MVGGMHPGPGPCRLNIAAGFGKERLAGRTGEPA